MTYSLSMTKHETSPAAITFTVRTSSLKTEWRRKSSYYRCKNIIAHQFRHHVLLYLMHNYFWTCIIFSLPPQSFLSKPLSLRKLRKNNLLFMVGLLLRHFHLASTKERGNEKDVMLERAGRQAPKSIITILMQFLKPHWHFVLHSLNLFLSKSLVSGREHATSPGLC